MKEKSHIEDMRAAVRGDIERARRRRRDGVVIAPAVATEPAPTEPPAVVGPERRGLGGRIAAIFRRR